MRILLMVKKAFAAPPETRLFTLEPLRNKPCLVGRRWSNAAASLKLLDTHSLPRARSNQRNDGMSSLLPYKMPAWAGRCLRGQTAIEQAQCVRAVIQHFFDRWHIALRGGAFHALVAQAINL